MHSCTRRVSDDNIRPPVLLHKVLGKDVFHITGKEQRVVDTIEGRVNLGILDGIFDIFDAHHLAGIACHEVGNSSCASIKIIDQRILLFVKTGEMTGMLVQFVCLAGIGLIERLWTYLESQSFHLFDDVILAPIAYDRLVAPCIIKFTIDHIH